ncbi:alpha-methylacyl-CoA racemase [Adelges cooleyi]|uniref:alpha-methylacyl-CoA racemase n=1 Tax=Adelges cooleyi TaxID=133065 RepID=UPI00217F7887|nr:alpha-methylacyl-CoA racemase [Adelges cooleyi]
MPLKGLKVLEFSGLAPVPFVGAILSDFGAKVTVIEQTNASFAEFTNLLSHGKRSISINLKHSEGVKIVKKLAKSSDILVEPFRPGVMEKLGLGPSVLMAENPMLIYSRLNGYGSNGYYSKRAGHDINYLAISGLLSLYGGKNPKPIPPVNFSEFTGGSILCVLGILMAVIARPNIKKGQIVDANVTEGIAYAGSWFMRSQDTLLWGRPKGHNFLDGGMHFYDTYETKDGKWMAVGAIEPQFYQELLQGLGLDPDDMAQLDEEENEKNREIFSKVFKEKTQGEWCKIFDSKDACVTPVLNFKEVAQHPHNKSRNSFIEKNNIVIPKPAPKLNETPGISSAHNSIVSCGQHTSEILMSIGYSVDKIKELKINKIVYQDPKSKI